MLVYHWQHSTPNRMYTKVEGWTRRTERDFKSRAYDWRADVTSVSRRKLIGRRRKWTQSNCTWVLKRRTFKYFPFVNNANFYRKRALGLPPKLIFAHFEQLPRFSFRLFPAVIADSIPIRVVYFCREATNCHGSYLRKKNTPLNKEFFAIPNSSR